MSNIPQVCTPPPLLVVNHSIRLSINEIRKIAILFKWVFDEIQKNGAVPGADRPFNALKTL